MVLKVISEDFFEKDSSYVAKALLGATINNTIRDYTIIETEAYYHDDMDKRGKLICYGADKTKETATEATAPLFDKPGTWCIYGGQLLISVTNDTNSDNVLIKKCVIAPDTFTVQMKWPKSCIFIKQNPVILIVISVFQSVALAVRIISCLFAPPN